MIFPYIRCDRTDQNAHKLLIELIKEEFAKIDKESGIGPKHYQKLNNLEEKLLKIQDLYIDGDLSKEEYQKAKMRCQNLINELKEKEKQLEKKQEVFQLYKNGLKGLESIENQYIKSDLDNKRRLIGSIFPKKFQFENKKVRTADINPILHKIARFNSVNRKNKKRDKSKKEDLSRCVLKTGLEPVRPKGHWILSPTCLPIPPLQHLGIF